MIVCAIAMNRGIKSGEEKEEQGMGGKDEQSVQKVANV